MGHAPNSLSALEQGQHIHRKPKAKVNLKKVVLCISGFVLFLQLFDLVFLSQSGLASAFTWAALSKHKGANVSPSVKASLHSRCASIRQPAGHPSSFLPSSRLLEGGNERFVSGTPPTWIRNAKIWTGARNGTEVVFGDLWLDKGMVIKVGYVPKGLVDSAKGDVRIIDAKGKWATPGLVDLHSHIGVSSSPDLQGTHDGNSHAAPILPWLRSVDGLNTHDESYHLAIAGGVTTAQILPGSADNIGGQAFVIKLRDTDERSTTSKVIEPPFVTGNSTSKGYVPWRHMKHACGENPDRLYGQTRMDAQWNFRNAYNEARKLKEKQDAFCGAVDNRDWETVDNLGASDFPEDLKWEALVDVLRGRVKLAVHCYEAVDLDGMVRLSNEFKFPIASFHHAGETWLVPDLLKKTWGGAPSIALFASNFKKKREAYRGSEFAPRVLADHGIPVVMKSDHPVLNSRYLLYEAQQAHYYGLPASLALASVTSTPAHAAGLGARVGTVREGVDADVVLWDSHPLTLGATPVQVWIDGLAQLGTGVGISLRADDGHFPLEKSESLQSLPAVPNWDDEAKEAVKFDGVPPLRGRVYGKELGRKNKTTIVRALNVQRLVKDFEDGPIFDIRSPKDTKKGRGVMEEPGRKVILRDGEVVCVEDVMVSCEAYFDLSEEREVIEVDLKGGSIVPGLVTFGSPLGLVDIRLESSTNDGEVWDPLTNVGPLPKMVADEDGFIVRAVDGLAFEGRNLLLAYRGGVTQAITPPSSSGFLRGLGVGFNTGARNALDNGAVVKKETGLHIRVSMGMIAGVSVSTQIAVLRKKLLVEDEDEGSEEGAWSRVRKGLLPLVVEVHSADIMGTLISLKREFETISGHFLKLTFVGATEAHLIAKEISKEGISVVVTSPRAYPGVWEQRRILPGPPLSRKSNVMTLLDAAVNVAIGVVDESAARNTRFELAWTALESNGTLLESQTIALATTNLRNALGLENGGDDDEDLVMYQGGDLLDWGSKVVGVVSAQRGVVELF